MIGLPGQCDCKCHNYGSNIENCNCGCSKCPHCNKPFVSGLIRCHIDICKPYYEAGLHKKEKDEKNYYE